MSGPILQALEQGCTRYPDLIGCLARIGTNPSARLVVYEADLQLRRERNTSDQLYTRSMSEIVRDGDLAEVLTEAICAAEALGL